MFTCKRLNSCAFLRPGVAAPAGSREDVASVCALQLVWGAGHSLARAAVLRVVLCVSGESSMIMEIELQSQVLDAMNYVLYDQLKFKGNRMDYYNALNLYMHQVNVGVLKHNHLYFLMLIFDKLYSFGAQITLSFHLSVPSETHFCLYSQDIAVDFYFFLVSSV